jgi:WD40 repeat protein
MIFRFIYRNNKSIFVSLSILFLLGLPALLAKGQNVKTKNLETSFIFQSLLDRDDYQTKVMDFTHKSELFLVSRNRKSNRFKYSIGKVEVEFVPCFESDIIIGKLSQNSRYLGLSCYDNSIEAWDLEKSRLVYRQKFVKLKESDLLWAFVSNDGTRLLISNLFGSDFVQIWDLVQNKKLGDLDSSATICSCNRTVYKTGFSNEGKILATTFGGMVFLWDSETGKLKHRLIDDGAKLYGDAVLSHKGIVSQVVFTNDSKTVITGAYDGTTKFWDVETGKLIRTFKKHHYRIDHLALSRDEATLATASRYDDFQLWDLKTGNLIWNSPDLGRDVKYLAFSPDGKRIRSETTNRVTIWDIPSRKPIEQMNATEDVFPYFSPDWKLVTLFDKKTKTMGLYEYNGK